MSGEIKIILASQSPRRRDLLSQLGVNFTCEPTDADETLNGTYLPADAVCELSQRKAKACPENHKNDNVFVIAADTVVYANGRIIGKPHDENDAYETLKTLSGKTHFVYTGLTLCTNEKSVSISECTRVQFGTLSDREIRGYIKTGEPFDKAGGYGVQGKAASFVKSIDGDFFNVVGLPLYILVNAAREEFGIELTF